MWHYGQHDRRRRRPAFAAAITATTSRYGVSGDVLTVTATADTVTSTVDTVAITPNRAADCYGVSNDGASGA